MCENELPPCTYKLEEVCWNNFNLNICYYIKLLYFEVTVKYSTNAFV